jgi:nicotinate phosphoribosyltransferase
MDIMKERFPTARDEPLIDTRLRNDVYKWTMMYFAIQQEVQNTPVVFGLTNRDPSLRLADVIPESFLREQLDHYKSLKMTPAQASFLQGMTVEENGKHMFMFPDPSFASYLQRQTVSDYQLSTIKEEGQFDLRFDGTWFAVQYSSSLWEVPAMSIICQSYVYWYVKNLLDTNQVTKSEVRAWFAEADQRIVNNAKLFRDAPGNPTFAQFGLRREVSTYHTRRAQAIIDDICPNSCIGVSDTQLSYELGNSNPKGTKAHEEKMVWANLGPDTDDWIRESQFDADLKWAETFPRTLRILLPDCYGTKQYYEHAPAQIAKLYAGTRIDSMETYDHDLLFKPWLNRHDVDSESVIVIPSDRQTARKFLPEHKQFANQYLALSAGMGGAWTNDIKGIAGPLFRTPDIVIKSWYANGRPCTKVGDAPNGGKVTGPCREHNQRVIRAVSPEGWAKHKGTLAA